jgi:hypothetical protein
MIKKISLLAALLLIFSLSACEDEETMKLPPRPGMTQIITQESGNQTEDTQIPAFSKPVKFAGAASGDQHLCIDQDCNTCKSTGTISVTLNPDSSTYIEYKTQCYGYGMGGCIVLQPNCMFVVKGIYHKDYGNMIFSSCSGSDKVMGSGFFGEDNATGNVSCIANGEIVTDIEWNGIAKAN